MQEMFTLDARYFLSSGFLSSSFFFFFFSVKLLQFNMRTVGRKRLWLWQGVEGVGVVLGLPGSREENRFIWTSGSERNERNGINNTCKTRDP